MATEKKIPAPFVINPGLQGLKLLSTFDKTDRKLVSGIIAGRSDNALKSAFRLMNNGIDKPYYIDSAVEESYLEAFKNHLDKPEIYKDFVIPVDKANETIKAIKDIQEQGKALMKGMNRPHPEGSTKALADRHGVSLSDIRRERAAGTLNKFLQSRKVPAGVVHNEPAKEEPVTPVKE